MAVLDYVKLYRDKGTEAWGKLQPRQKVIFSALGIGVVMLFLGIALLAGPGTGGFVPLAGSVENPETAMKRLLLFGINSRLVDGAVVVPADKEERAALILATSGMLPNAKAAYKFLNEASLASTDARMQKQYYVELQGILGASISAMTGINQATVNLTPPVQPYHWNFNREDLRAKASVAVDIDGTLGLTETQTIAIAQLVAGSVETMRPENVVISDLRGRAYQLPVDWAQTISLNRTRDSIESSLRTKAERILESYSGRAEVTVEMISGERTLTNEIVPEQEGVVTSSEIRESNRDGVTRAGSAGSEADIGRDSTNDPSRVARTDQENLAESREIRAISRTKETIKDSHVKPDYARSSIACTISDQFQLTPEQLDQLRLGVANSTKIPLDQVSIMAVPMTTGEFAAQAGMGGGFVNQLLGDSNLLVKVIMLVVAIVAFVSLMVMMKKSAPKPLTLIDEIVEDVDDEPLPEVPSLPPVDQLSGNLVREKVVDLVRKNPKAAANLVKRWLIVGK